MTPAVASVRPPAVAGSFYSGEAQQLQQEVNHYLAHPGVALPPLVTPPRAVILPHAGYRYSGMVAATGYRLLAPFQEQFGAILLLGPSHRLGFRGIATCSHSHYQTPLGEHPIAHQLEQGCRSLSWYHTLDEAHRQEHSLEVHLPFIQQLFPHTPFLPLVVGDASAEEVQAVIDTIEAEMSPTHPLLTIVSSDLSHFHSNTDARAVDRQTAAAIIGRDIDAIHGENACGSRPLKGVLLAARNWGEGVTCLELRNSADSGGDRNRVVGYGAFRIG
ncbi:MAG: AmmeMemoRadiSam system protein B [Gammaproteobacteria bacterium]|nr:AmmeMemoRadiSam system protein B [Gammaproteobacteria bacterium]